MKQSYAIGAAAGALIVAGLGVSIERADTEVGAAFLHPLALAQSICGDGADGLAERRRFFVRAASAYAASLTPEMETANTLTPMLGQISYGVTTSEPDAQAWFNQGLAYTYNFNHGEAVKAFKRAQEIDPDCAMCFWGEAFALGPNINAPMSEEAVAPAYAAVKKAIALSEAASEKETAIINALSKRYGPKPVADRSGLDNAFADAMDAVALQYPDDDFIAALAAEANMDTQAWDYWQDGGRTPKGRTARTISLLEGVLARNPQYTAAIHLYIHITEASQNPYRALEHADRLADLTPGLGHLIHMPSHTYYRIGQFEKSLAHNIRAVAVDEAYIDGADASIMYEYGYFTHNIHFAMTSAQMAGDSETALAMAEKLDGKLPTDMAMAVPFAQPIKAAPYYTKVMFAEPGDILALEAPSDEAPFLKAIWHYARGEALARQGDADAAMAEAEAISEIIANGDLSSLTNAFIPAPDILNIARLTVIARASAADGDLDTAIEAMEEAVALQDVIAYTEPPYWYYPAKQTLAAYVLQKGDATRAEQLFVEALAYSPNNAFVLYGLSEVYKAQGDKNGAKFARNLFKDAWLGDKAGGLSLASL
ncbi:MAG: tetratricopeptide repeat protein [Pseudomonadota bacterium]